MRFWAWLLFGSFTLAGWCLAPARAAAQSVASSQDTMRLRPGDRVVVTVWRQTELSGESVVSLDGTLNHPYYQTVPVAGVPIAVVKQRLLQFLVDNGHGNPLITVEPLFRVTVGGEVRQPNVYSLSSSATVAQAIAGAGGPSDRGRLSKVRLYRGGKRMDLDLNDPRSDQANMPIQSGDNVIVGRSKNFFRDVLAPGASLTAAIVSIIVVFRQ